jgi:DnaJ like chaperone protein
MIFFLGKIICAAGGYFSGLGIAGAVIGLIVGHFIDEIVLHLRNLHRLKKFYQDPDSTNLGGSNLVSVVTASILYSFMTETGKNSERERETVKQLLVRHLGFGLRDIFFIQKCIDHLSEADLENRGQTLYFVQIFRYHAEYRTRLRLAKLLSLFTSITEAQLLLAVFENLELRSEDKEHLLRGMEGIVRDYETLGVKIKASSGEIKRKFRQLATKYHPDRAANRSKEEIREAEQRFIEIKAAYDNIMKSRRKRGG